MMILRTKKPKKVITQCKIKRGKKIMRNKKPVVEKFGGCFPNPPLDCRKKEFTFQSKNGTIWIDLSICHTCNKIKECETRKEHLDGLKKSKI